LGLNDSATVGWAENILGQQQAFVHDGTNLINLDETFTGSLATATAGSAAAAINDAGTIVGQAWGYTDYYPTPEGSTRYFNTQAFVSDGSQSWALTDLVNSTASWKIASASDINAGGQIAATADLRVGYYNIQNAVVLTPETAWTASGSGSWDTADNWHNSTIPGANGAAFLNLADGVTVTGPAADHSLYALTMGSTGTSSTLQLQAGGNLTVRGDTELRTGGIIDATAATLATSYLHGSGTVNGTVDAGRIYIGQGQTLTLQGTVNAGALEFDTTGILKVSGVFHSPISGNPYSWQPSNGTIELTGNATLGGTDISGPVKIGTLNLAGHSASFLTSGTTGVSIEDRLLGGGTLTGNVAVQNAVIQPGVGNSLEPIPKLM
jgi:hypothetical protein